MGATVKQRSIFILKAVDNHLRRRSITSAAAATTHNQHLKSWKQIPSLSSLPFMGQLHHFLPGGRLNKLNDRELQSKLFEWYGPITKLSFPFKQPVIIIFDAAAIEQVLRNENWMPVREISSSIDYYLKYYSKFSVDSSKIYGFNSQGEYWKKTRSLANPAVMDPKTVKLYAPVMTEVAEDFVNWFKSLREDKIRLQTKFDTVMELWALESVGAVVLGKRLNCFDANLPEDSPVMKLIKCTHDFFNAVQLLDHNPGAALWKYIPTKDFKKAMKIYEDLFESMTYFTILKLKDLREKGSGNENSKCVFEQLFVKDEQVAAIAANDLLMGGIDTSSLTAFGTLYMLATNPEKQHNLRKLLKSEKEGKTYVKSCIKESLRLMPVSDTSVMRKTTKKHNLLGYEIPENMTLRFYQRHLSTMESNFPRANEFIPERWMVPVDDPLYYGNAHPFAYFPFGFGVRSCVGRRIAELNLEILLSKMVQNFQIDWIGPPPNITPSIINYVNKPFYFEFKEI